MSDKKLQHLAIILDGNRRWARAKGLPTFDGHREGVEAAKRVIEACLKFGIKYLTVYAFSTENWKRTEEEVGYLMKLAFNHIGKGEQWFNERNVRVRIFGRLDNIDEKLAESFRSVMAATRDNDGLYFNICFNYGGRMEITEAVKCMIADGKQATDITEDLVTSYLYSAGQPDPDMIVRAGAEHRLSNFLPWQSTYSEFYFPETFWPDFDEGKISEVIAEFEKRNRRFGK